MKLKLATLFGVAKPNSGALLFSCLHSLEDQRLYLTLLETNSNFNRYLLKTKLPHEFGSHIMKDNDRHSSEEIERSAWELNSTMRQAESTLANYYERKYGIERSSHEIYLRAQKMLTPKENMRMN